MNMSHANTSEYLRSAAGPPEEKLKKLRSSRDLAPIKNLPKKTSKSNKRKMKVKSATLAKTPVMEAAAMPAAHIAPPRRAAAATAQAISEAQQVCFILEDFFLFLIDICVLRFMNQQSCLQSTNGTKRVKLRCWVIGETLTKVLSFAHITKTIH